MPTGFVLFRVSLVSSAGAGRIWAYGLSLDRATRAKAEKARRMWWQRYWISRSSVAGLRA